MSDTLNSVRFSGDFSFYDANFQADINSKMTVPKTLRVAGESDNDFKSGMAIAASDYFSQKFDMKVPDRILVAGQEQHVSAPAAPREFQLEQAVLPPDHDEVRIQTPPRSIRLDEHAFPTADDADKLMEQDETMDIDVTSRPNGFINITLPSADNSLLVAGDSVDEVQLIRRQMGRLSRRVMALELESQQRQQRDIMIASFGLAYFVLKILMWVHRCL